MKCMVFYLLLLPGLAFAWDEFGALRGLVCDAIKRAQSPKLVLNHDSIILDTNLIPEKQLLESLRQNTHRTDIRITDRGRREMFEINLRREKYSDTKIKKPEFKTSYFGFPEDPEAIPVREKVRSTLERLGLGKTNRSDGLSDQEILTEVFCAKAVDGPPVFATADTGIYKVLFKQTPMAQVVPENKILKRYYPRGFDVTIEVRTIRVIPVPQRLFLVN
jgi:hypothetical protein